MTNWLQRMGALFGGRPAAPVPPKRATHAKPPVAQAARARPAAAATESSLFAESLMPDAQVPFFEWLLGVGTTFDAPLLPAEKRLLMQLDAVLAADGSRAELLPRAPAVIPQLMNSLRDENQSARGLASKVERDPHLVAEVLRLANASGVRGSEPVSDLPQAISRLGTQGLRRAIAKVVLKPLFDAKPDSFSGRAAPRVWQHSEAKANECMRLAGLAGIDPFEGYLAGLMHDIGWTAALRVLDRAGGGAQPQFSRSFVEAFEDRRDAFFGMLVMPWALTDALTALAVELLDGGLAAAKSPLGQALLQADRHASIEMLGAGALLETMTVAPLGG